MAEIQKIQTNINKFGFINSTGFISLTRVNVVGFCSLGPNSFITFSFKLTLFICIKSCFEMRDVLGQTFIVFLAPGLIIQSMMLQSFSHSPVP